MQRHAIAVRARAELAAQPRVLIIGVNQQVIHAGEVGRKAPDQILVAIMHARVHDAVRRGVAIVAMTVVGRAEMKQRAHSGGFRHVEAASDQCASRLAGLGAGLADKLGGLRRTRRDFRRGIDEVFEVQRFVIRPRAPGEIELHLRETPAFQIREDFRRPWRGSVRTEAFQ